MMKDTSVLDPIVEKDIKRGKEIELKCGIKHGEAKMG